jgi:hypothetical protein
MVFYAIRGAPSSGAVPAPKAKVISKKVKVIQENLKSQALNSK